VASQLDADEVAPGLWVGRTPPDRTKLHGIDVVVLAAMELQPALLGVRTLRCPLDDHEPSRAEAKQAWRCAEEVVRLRQRGQKVLVACAMGVNRSAWIAAMVLMQEGMTAREAIRQIRKRRHARWGTMPLSNQHFVRVLEQLDDRRHRIERPHLQLVR
jgi:protein-tyrosine phosphatase